MRPPSDRSSEVGDLEAAPSAPSTSCSAKLEAASSSGDGSDHQGSGQVGLFSSLARVRPQRLQWHALRYIVPLGWRKRSYKTVLDGISGQAQPGELLAVMGPTGSGKTSLINALAGRLQGGKLAGEVLVNGRRRGPGFRSMTAFVMQDDALFPNLTVRETLLFAARVRLPGAVGRGARDALARGVLQHLGLAKAADTLVGGPLQRGVSGGERKRVSIGVELLSNPSILFVDEPTSGLDSAQAQNVMQALHTLAADGRIVVFSIHQPRSSIFAMFSQLLLVAEGRLVYSGPAAATAAHFAAAGHPCPQGFNPADWLLDVTSLDYRSAESEAASLQRVRELADLWAAHGDADVEAGTEEREAAPAGGGPAELLDAEPEAQPRYACSPVHEFGLLLGRAARQASRNHVEHAVLICQTIIIAATFAVLWSGMSPASPGGIQDEISLLFLCATTVAMNSMMGSLLLFTLERQVTDRERAACAYRVGSYYLARLLVGVPLRIVQGLLFGAIVYWAAGLNPSASAFFIFCSVIVVEDMAGSALGLLVSAAVPHEKIAMALAPMIVIGLMLFSGFYINSENLPAWLSWIKYISHLYYGLMGLAINDFRRRDDWACPVGSPQPCSVSGDAILAQLGFEGNSLGTAFLGLLLLAVALNLLGYACLRLRRPRYLPLGPAGRSHACGARPRHPAGSG